MTPAEAIRAGVITVTKDWVKQRKAEERNRNALLNRRIRLIPSYRVTIRDAAFKVMEAAYLKASDNGRLPVKPRQIMYAARPRILEMTGERELSGSYFSQTLLVDYMEEHDCSDWDVIWDARGHFIEPHTNREIPLGTLEVREYLGERPSFGELAIGIAKSEISYPTKGAKNRFGNILFIEKEGFHPILRAAQLQERFDVSIMSTKGMSVTASRRLLDALTPYVDHIFVLHDFDRSGFSICGTLGTDSRRYEFKNDPPLVDIGLRLADVDGLQSEPVPLVNPHEWRKRANTLRRHGTTREEIEFLQTRRVELNAMTSPQLVEFIEFKLKEHGVRKLVPDDNVLEQQARRIIQQRLIAKAINAVTAKCTKQAKAAVLPDDLRQQVVALLERRPQMPWDRAVARIIGNENAP